MESISQATFTVAICLIIGLSVIYNTWTEVQAHNKKVSDIVQEVAPYAVR